ncbi:MAG: hypothetical protein ACFFCH_08255 [Promethearchaeota archaeon]
MADELCFRCKRRPGKLFNRGRLVNTDQVNMWLGRPLFPHNKMVCPRCVREVAGVEWLHRLVEYVAYADTGM